MQEERGRYSRGYLPHVDLPGAAQFLTWRLADSVPAELISAWKQELAASEESQHKRELERRVEAYCDAGHGSCVLADPRCGRIVQETLFAHDGTLYTLQAWSIMPNHVHVLLRPGSPLGKILNQVKGASSCEINRLLRQSGKLWQREYFDRWMRDDEHFRRTAAYIERNPVKANLTTDPALWSWSSANSDAMQRLEFLRRGRAT